MRLAVVLGVSEYATQTRLPACRNDAEAIADVLQKSGRYEDICLLAGEVSAAKGKKAVVDFVAKHKGRAVSEVFFYFSGHGDRAVADFLHVFSDYSSKTRETTCLRNSELDELIRNLSPELTIKVVDACFSGTQYIKSQEDIQPTLVKSAEAAKLNKVYFLHSSTSSEESLAGPDYSVFTESVLRTIANASGELRYRDLMAGVADDLENQQVPKPTFVQQASNLEVFVDVTPELASTVSARLSGSGGNGPTKQSEPSASDHSETALQDFQPASLAELAAKMSEEVFCTEAEASENLRVLNRLAEPTTWPSEIRTAFDISAAVVDSDKTPNATAIGKWLQTTGKTDDLFAQPTFRAESYETEEYKELPKKPRSVLDKMSAFSALAFLAADQEYKLVKVQKNRSVLTGYSYTVDPVIPPKTIRFSPKFPALEHYAVTVLCFFSRKTVHVVHAVEHLPFKDWTDASAPKATDWEPQSAPLKDQRAIEALVVDIVGSVSDFVLADAKRRLSAPRTTTA